MRVVALISWIVTALAGATLFGIWVARGGPRRQGAGATRFPPPLIFGHPLLAATGLIIWIIHVATDTDVLAGSRSPSCWWWPPSVHHGQAVAAGTRRRRGGHRSADHGAPA